MGVFDLEDSMDKKFDGMDLMLIRTKYKSKPSEAYKGFEIIRMRVNDYWDRSFNTKYFIIFNTDLKKVYVVENIKNKVIESEYNFEILDLFTIETIISQYSNLLFNYALRHYGAQDQFKIVYF